MSGLNSLAEDLKRTLEEGRNCDVKLVCEGEEIPVHSLIISARSRVFATMLETDMKERKSGIITIQGGASVEVVKQLVRFLYSDQTDKRFVMFEELLLLAHMYEIQALVDHCSMNIDLNLLSVLKISAWNEKLNSSILADRIKEILAHSMRRQDDGISDDVVEGWTKFYKNSPEVAVKVLYTLFIGTSGCMWFNEDGSDRNCEICKELRVSWNPDPAYRVKIAERDAQRAIEFEAAQRANDNEADNISDSHDGWGDE